MFRSLIALRNVTKVFDRQGHAVPALDRMSFSVGRDEPLSGPIATSEDASSRGAINTLTLAVTPDQARALAEARRIGELDVVLLPPSPQPATSGAHA